MEYTDKSAVANQDAGAAASLESDGADQIVSLNVPKLDVRDSNHQVVAAKPVMCSKTCNSR